MLILLLADLRHIYIVLVAIITGSDSHHINGEEEVCVQVLLQEVSLWEVSGWSH